MKIIIIAEIMTNRARLLGLLVKNAALKLLSIE